MERPELRGIRRLVKAAVDKTAATLGILFLALLLLAVAVAVEETRSSPVPFRQKGGRRDGLILPVLKFRSMMAGADRMGEELQSNNDGNGVPYKEQTDPRITSVRCVLRRYSIDELTQLFNVLGGSMSLVGPRPPLQREVEQYGHDMQRRSMVKAVLTGLWQVSGRSDLSREGSVRIDVRYVENWSLTFDFMILWKTASSCAAPGRNDPTLPPRQEQGSWGP